MGSLILGFLFVGLSAQLPWSPSNNNGPQGSPWGCSISLTRKWQPTPTSGPWPANPTAAGSEPVPAQPTGSGDVRSYFRQKYLFPVVVEGQSYELVLDTGSSDTWIAATGYQCYRSVIANSLDFVTPEALGYCGYTPTYAPGGGFTASDTIFMDSCYGQSGEDTRRCVAGLMGTVDVDIGGLVASSQLIGVPGNISRPASANDESGILGLAFNDLTGGYTIDGLSRSTYSSIANTLLSSAPDGYGKFALALSRDEANTTNGGVMTIGILPDLNDPEVNVTSAIPSSADMQILNSETQPDRTFYAINIDSVFLEDEQGSQALVPNLLLVIDSGANAIQFPVATADYLNSFWSSSPVSIDGIAQIDCDATFDAELGFTIGGQRFLIDTSDLIQFVGNGNCESLIQGRDEGILLLGDPFLKSVLAVFDWDVFQMHFYSRRYYLS